jgi:hypothetical protein
MTAAESDTGLRAPMRLDCDLFVQLERLVKRRELVKPIVSQRTDG